MKIISIRLNDEEEKLISEFAQKENRSVSNYIKTCALAYANAEQFGEVLAKAIDPLPPLTDPNLVKVEYDKPEEVDNTELVEEHLDTRELKCPFCKKSDEYPVGVFNEGGYNCKRCKKWVELNS